MASAAKNEKQKHNQVSVATRDAASLNLGGIKEQPTTRNLMFFFPG